MICSCVYQYAGVCVCVCVCVHAVKMCQNAVQNLLLVCWKAAMFEHYLSKHFNKHGQIITTNTSFVLPDEVMSITGSDAT